MKTLNIAQEFSTTPGARYENEGPFPGKEFREQYLAPQIKNAIENSEELEINLDGTAGLGTSFLEESFGGLIREDKIPYQTLLKTLKFVSLENPDYIEEINQYMKEADEKAE